MQYRATLFGNERTRWRDTRDQAVADAIRRGWASREDYQGANVFFNVGVTIEQRARP